MSTITYGYQWERDGMAISGATEASYLVTAADIGATISCAVTATDGTVSAVAGSAPTAMVEAAGYSGTSLGVLQADTAHTSTDASGGVRLAMIECDWGRYELTQGTFSPDYKAQLVSQADAIREAGMVVGVVPGLHNNTPPWVTSLPNGCYTDQNGGTEGANGGPYANLMFSTQVRAAATAYLTDLVQTIGTDVAYFRLGIGEYGECFLPDTKGEQWWAFDGAAQGPASELPAGVGICPMVGWKPGTPTWDSQTVTSDMAQSWWSWYHGALLNTLEWEIATFRAAGYTGQIQAPCPGDGCGPFLRNLRFSQVLAASSTDTFHTVNTGAAWDLTIAALGAYDPNLTLDCTSLLDGSGSPANNHPAPGDASSIVANADPWISDWSDARWLRYLATAAGMRFVAETATADTPSSETARMCELAVACSCDYLLWLTDDDLYQGGTTSSLAEVVTALNAANL